MKTIFALLVALSFAQSPRDGVDPFATQRRITDSCDQRVSVCANNFDVAGLWRTLGIPDELKTVGSRRPAGTDESTFRRCRAVQHHHS